ncbi:unnamed protein product [Protopolystoma xenopodis]|uniref:RanBD1 domain-containing protein n=1 Tax=Protopolystoma xenopodis TaxID=117903 RepID=A0A448XQT4_9PLAT|nr:unnamed protein product [Protopolystoma xenopodis]
MFSFLSVSKSSIDSSQPDAPLSTCSYSTSATTCITQTGPSKPLFQFQFFNDRSASVKSPGDNTLSFGVPNSGTQKHQFMFSFPPHKPSTSPHLPDESPNVSIQNVASVGGGDEDDCEVVPVDEDRLHFKPILDHLPDCVEPYTGEEGETVVFSARSKLFRWSGTGEKTWRERGIGELKLLHSENSDGSMPHTRLIMRRDQVFKVCANHRITGDMELSPMSAGAGAEGIGTKAWTWRALDFSEPANVADIESEMNKSVNPNEEPTVTSIGRPELFAVRFKTVELAEAFKIAFEAAVLAASADNLTKYGEKLKKGQTWKADDMNKEHEEEKHKDIMKREHLESPTSKDLLHQSALSTLPSSERLGQSDKTNKPSSADSAQHKYRSLDLDSDVDGDVIFISVKPEVSLA